MRGSHAAPGPLGSLHAVEGMYVEWRRLQQGGLEDTFKIPYAAPPRTYAKLPRYEPGVIPGLLQPPQYATHRPRRIAEFGGLVDDVDSAVAARMLRRSGS